MVGAVALEVSCVLGLVRLGFAATVYPADAQVILRLPGPKTRMCRRAPFLVGGFVCVISERGVVKTGFAAAVYPADAQVTLRLLSIPRLICALLPGVPPARPALLVMDVLAQVVDVVLGEVVSGFAAPVYPADANSAALLPCPAFAPALLSALSS